jgi:hypothetical protein
MGYKRKDINTGDWVCLDDMPWFPDAYARGEDRNSITDMRGQFPSIYKKVTYYKVVKMAPLMYEFRTASGVYRDGFLLRWVTDVQVSYNDVIKKRESK